MDFEKFLMTNKVSYEIVRLRNQQKKTYADISHQLKLSVSRINQKYRKFSFDLLNFYIHYLKSISIVVNKWEIYNFYECADLSVAYLELTYKEYLDLLRQNVPPIFLESCTNFLPYRELTEEDILELEQKILKAKMDKRRSFADMGSQLGLTRKKTKQIYDSYYHKKTLIAFERIRPTVNFSIEDYVYRYTNSTLKRWQLIVNEYAEFVQDLID